jgi:2-desacetyl-2-hydroxyethyl bacteriochlorophyllide A dehydrogenase
MERFGRTVEFVGPREVTIARRPVRDPGPREVTIKSIVSGISAGTEMNVYRGVAPQWRNQFDETRRLFLHEGTPDWSYPIVYGYANVGSVEATGDDVAGLKRGDLVFSYSPHQDWSVVDAAEVVVLPSLAKTEHGILVANLNTALNGVLDARPALMSSLVVSGLGVIGLLVVQLARAAGVAYIAGMDPVEHRRAMALRLGATEVFEPGPAVAEAIRAKTDNRGADVVIEVSGAPAALNEAIRIVGLDGLVIAMSWYSGSFASLDLSGEFHHNRVHVRASQVDEVNPDLGPLWSTQRRLSAVLSLLTTLDLDPLFTHRFPIDAAADAYRCVDELRDGLVQCVLTY